MARGYAMARLGAGAALALAPGLGGRLLGETTGRGSVRLLGVRDMLLGLDALLEMPGSPSWRRAMVLCAMADGADALASAGRLRRGDPMALVVVVTAAAAIGAATGLWLARSPRVPSAGT